MNFWETAYRQNIAKMIGVCRRYTRDSQDAEDLAHDAFLIAIDKFSSFENKGPFEAWLRRITVNVALQHLREQNRQKYIEQYSTFIETQDENHCEEYLSFTETELLNTINLLPEHHRLVFNLYVIDNYTHAQIGDELGISEGTSKSHLARARKKLRELLVNNLEQNKDGKRAFFLFFLPFKLFNVDWFFKKNLRNLDIQPRNTLALESAEVQSLAVPRAYFSTSLIATVGSVSVVGLTALLVQAPPKQISQIEQKTIEVLSVDKPKENLVQIENPKKTSKSSATIFEKAIIPDENIKNFDEMKNISTIKSLFLAGAVLAADSSSLPKNLFTDYTSEELKTQQTIRPITDEDKKEAKGSFYASKLHWSGKDNKIYVSGALVKGNFESSNFGGIGKFSFMGEVGYLVIDGVPFELGRSIKLADNKYNIVRLSSKEAIKKYGENGKSTVVEISKAD
ncbi:MAG: RNA polymerase sigma factor [Spirosomaceae bacterium]|jgi:RNA polymerase sigma factor (sigma-70 family)|nr:RNA polymerase sigma factor [Spirosomataceae bacterium]